MRSLLIFAIVFYPFGFMNAEEVHFGTYEGTWANVMLAEGTVLCSMFGDCKTTRHFGLYRFACVTNLETGSKFLGHHTILQTITYGTGGFETTLSYNELYFLLEQTPCPEKI